MDEFKIDWTCNQSVCTINIAVPETNNIYEEKEVINIKNCDIFAAENHLAIYLDNKLLWVCIPTKFDGFNINLLTVNYDSKNRILKVSLPCDSISANAGVVTMNTSLNQVPLPTHCKSDEHVDLWKLKRVTTNCCLFIDDRKDGEKLESNYRFGFASRFKGAIDSIECNLDLICRMAEPNLFSPIHRSVVREIEELKDFNREEYKQNCFCLDVVDGYENPLDVIVKWDNDISKNQQCILEVLRSKSENLYISDQIQLEIDCGLISILLATSYDLRTTSNEPTCESGWTRSILTPTLYYFEPFSSLQDVIIAFFRRSLIYPLYRNYDLSRLCVEDVIALMNLGPHCIAKQLLVTKELFADGHPSRAVFNTYYVNDYIAYVSSDTYCTQSYLRTLSNNLKHTLSYISKKHIRLNLPDIESEALKEIVLEETAD